MRYPILTMSVGAFGWGVLTDRFGPMIVVLSGGLLLGLGLALASGARVRHWARRGAIALTFPPFPSRSAVAQPV